MRALLLESLWESQISIWITDISELENVFIIQDKDTNVMFSKKKEIDRATATWTEVTGKEMLESQ